MEKGQAGLRRSQLKMQVCGAWVFWSQGLKEEGHDPEGRGEGAGGGKGSSALRRGRGWRPRTGSKRSDGKAADRGLPLPQRALSLLRLQEAAPRVMRKAVERSGGQSGLGKPFQLLVLLQFPHPAEKQGRSQRRPADRGGRVGEVAGPNPVRERTAPVPAAPQESHDLPGCLVLLLGEKGASGGRKKR